MMEIRARYILMGLFLLAVIGGAFGFVYWLENAGGFRDRTTYNIRFDGPVSGLLSGSAVLFNGIRVGEVTALRISADRPNEVRAEIAVNNSTPIRSDTTVDLEYQGLTGVASIALAGGEGSAPLIERTDGTPTLVARAGAGQNVTQSAREALLKLQGILEENSEPFKELIANINEFSGALARNSGKVDGILAGLERMTGGSRGPDTDKIFDLSIPDKSDTPPKKLSGLLMVPLPTAIFQLDGQNILFRKTKDDAPLPHGPRWADNLTRLLQAKVVQSFENAGYIDSVGHADALTGEYQLLIDIRSFQLITTPEPVAEVEFSARIANMDGKIIGAKLFRATAPSASTDTGPAVASLNGAFKKNMSDLIAWAGDVLQAPQEPASIEEPTTLAEPANSETPSQQN